MSARAQDELAARLERLEGLVRQMETGPETPLHASARRLVEAVLDLHADALRAMIEGLAESEDGRRALEAWKSHPAISAVLLLHGVHPVPLEARVKAALDPLAATLHQHGARVAAVTVASGVVHVRVERADGRAGAPASALRARLEETLVGAAPDASAIEVDVPEAPTAFVPVEAVRLRDRGPGGRAR